MINEFIIYINDYFFRHQRTPMSVFCSLSVKFYVCTVSIDRSLISYPPFITLVLYDRSWPTEWSSAMGARGNRLPSNSKPLTSLVGHGTVAQATVAALSSSSFFSLHMLLVIAVLWKVIYPDRFSDTYVTRVIGRKFIDRTTRIPW